MQAVSIHTCVCGGGVVYTTIDTNEQGRCMHGLTSQTEGKGLTIVTVHGKVFPILALPAR